MELLRQQKKWLSVGNKKRGKDTKIMAIADASGIPVAAYVGRASPHEVKLVEETIESGFTQYAPNKIIGDKAYYSDGLDQRLLVDRNIEMIAPIEKDERSRKPRMDES